ncbi:M3 family metallopeptidase [Pseudomonas sp. RIT623]|uniref:M3 family metallopeptidase n=1 Tax=Pseudomonas sp. RIT623 TaxID=2559075 RepID=UPI00106F2C2C|nr:M3 family metallopeptidase [Pseudomonas sp. RIT623]TFF43138.1 peptidase M3 [Pseudomonas sp. RIT623]
MSANNPLLQPSAVPINYNAITLDNARAAFTHAVDAHREGIARLIDDQRDQPTWDDLVLAVDALDARLMAVMMGVSPLTYRGDDWIDLVNDFYGQLLTRFDEKLANSELQGLYQRLADSPQGMNLDAHERATLNWYRDAFVLQGASLDQAGKAKLAAYQAEILGLARQFGENIYLAGNLITDKTLLPGIPDRVLAGLAQKARAEGKDGWLIGTDKASTRLILELASDRGLREATYRRHHQRGVGGAGRKDNGALLLELAQARDKKARLLGFADHSTLSLKTKSAGSLAQVQAFLHGLAQRIRPIMVQRRAALKNLASGFGVDSLQPWDRHYVQQLERQSAQLPSMDRFREYFTLAKVIEALQTLVQRLFGVRLVRAPAKMAVWQATVEAFEVWLDHALVGYLYVDALQYPGKRVDQVETRYVYNRRVDPEGQFHPAVAMVFSDIAQPPAGSQPLLDHLALRKLFHEFGHALHHLLVRTTNHVNSNIGALGTDGVEVFGKLFERWVWDAGYLAAISAHKDHGGSLLQAELERLLESLRRAELDKAADDLALALFDLDLHATPNDGRSLRRRLEEARARCGYWPLEAYEHPAHSFDYLLSYYDAGYYAYVWSDVHAFDLFSRFQANGLTDRKTGLALQTALLDPGAARPLRDGMRIFLGREPNDEAYLAWHGLN